MVIEQILTEEKSAKQFTRNEVFLRSLAISLLLTPAFNVVLRLSLNVE